MSGDRDVCSCIRYIWSCSWSCSCTVTSLTCCYWPYCTIDTIISNSFLSLLCSQVTYNDQCTTGLPGGLSRRSWVGISFSIDWARESHCALGGWYQPHTETHYRWEPFHPPYRYAKCQKPSGVLSAGTHTRSLGSVRERPRPALFISVAR